MDGFTSKPISRAEATAKIRNRINADIAIQVGVRLQWIIERYFLSKVRKISVTLYESSNILIDGPLDRCLNYPLAHSLSFWF